MPPTTTLTLTYQQLKDMDQQIADAESHLRVLKAANFPGTLKLEGDLAKAKTSRAELMKAIDNEVNK